MGNLQRKFLDTKAFYNMSLLVAPKARCNGCRKWNRRVHLFRHNKKRYCIKCTPADTFNNSIDYNELLSDDTPLLQ